MNTSDILADVPVYLGADRLDFGRYVDPLFDIITNEYAATPFTIGIFGTWGSGKSSVIRMLDERLNNEAPSKFINVHFDPWVHRGEPNMLVPLLHTLHDALKANAPMSESAKRLSEVLLRLGAGVLLTTLTAGSVSIDDLDKMEREYHERRGAAYSEMRRLRQTLAQTAADVAKGSKRIVLFVDNLDRCNAAEIIGVLESIKIFLDIPHVFVVIAVDKEVIDRGVQMRYHQFEFARDRYHSIGAEYLEKLVQLPLHLQPLSPDTIGVFIQTIAPRHGLELLVPLLQRIVRPNPRQIKRLVNILLVARSIFRRAGVDADDAMIARLIALQVQHPELYAHGVRQPTLISALEAVYQGNESLSHPSAFAQHGQLAGWLVERCKVHYQPSGELAELFKDSTFATNAAQMRQYFSILGG